MPRLRNTDSVRSKGSGSRGWRLAPLAAVLAVAVVFMGSAPAGAADAQTETIGLIITRSSLEQPAGEVVELATIDVDPSLVGRSCTLSASVYNQFSVNPDNDIVVATGGSQMTIANVEAEADQTYSGSMDVVAGETVTFTLIRGSRVFSAHMSMTLECEDEPEPATTTTTTTEAPAPAESTTTTTTVVTTTTVATTTTAVTEVAGEVAQSQPAVPQPGQPVFTG